MTDRVRFDEQARMAIKRGFDVMADVAQVTLGPIGGTVALERIAQSNRSPELLTDIATISRRILEIPDPFENMGAMLARHLAWYVREEVGDGSATALVIAQAIIDHSVRYIAAGHNAMALWRGIKKGHACVDARLKDLAEPLEDPDRIASLATYLAKDEQIGRFIEEIFDIVGPQGFVEVRDGYGRESERDYVEGVYWNEGWVSSYFADKGNETQATAEDAYILFTDHSLEEARDLIPAMDIIRRAGGKALVVIAYGVKGNALNLLVSNYVRGTMRTLALKAPRYGDARLAILEDMAISTGGRVIRESAGDLVSHVKLEDLGRAQHVVCSRATFTIVGGSGNPRAIRERIRQLQNVRDQISDQHELETLDERVGKLLGGTAILNVGGKTKSEREQLKGLAEGAVRVVRLGLEEGIVPGGGSAYVAALPALGEAEVTADEAPALNILREALVAPVKCLVRNAGYSPGLVVAHIQESPPGWGFDVIEGKMVDMMKANIVDPLPAVRSAWTRGVSAATMAITTDALVYRSDHDESPSYNP